MLAKVRHLLPMLSLFSVNSPDEVRAWNRKLLARLPEADAATAGPDGSPLDWVIEPKVDGLAVSLLYKDGKLLRVSLVGLWNH